MPFTYGFTPEGTLVPMDDERLLALAEDYGVRPFLHLSTLTAAGTFSAAQAAVVLRSETLQRTLAEAALQKMQEKGYQGLDVDFEYLGQELAEAYAQFLTLLHERLAPYGLPLIAALAPKTSADQPGTLYEGHDYAAVASACDAVLLMTYEWGYTYGPPMAVAPIGAVRRVVEFALTQMEPGKILLGFQTMLTTGHCRSRRERRGRSPSGTRPRRCSRRSTARKFNLTSRRRHRISLIRTRPDSRRSLVRGRAQRAGKVRPADGIWPVRGSATGTSCGHLQRDSACRITCFPSLE